MVLQSYCHVSRQQQRQRRSTRVGFRLRSRPRRFSVNRLQSKIMTIFGFINRCMRFLCMCPKESSSRNPKSRDGIRTDSRRALVQPGREEAKLRSYVRSNSFYAEAIKDCLDFINRNSVPLDSYSETSSRCSSDRKSEVVL